MGDAWPAAGDARRNLRFAKLPARFAIAAAAVAVTATTTATTTITAIATAAAVAAEATTTAATAAIFTRFGLVDFQRATADFFAIELFNSRVGFFGRRHFDEGKAARPSGHAIFDDAG